MKKQADFYAEVHGGNIRFKNVSLFKQFLSTFPDGTPIKITVGQQYGEVSKNQMAYYYGVIIPAAMEEYGYLNPEDADRAFKATFLVENKGTEYERLKSKSKDLDVVEMSEYLEKCIKQLAIDGVVVPPADPEWRIKK